MSNHVFDIFNSSSRNSIKVTSKINGGKSHFSNNFQPVKPLEATPLRTKSNSGLSIRQPLADCRSFNQLKVSTTVKPLPLKLKEIKESDRYIYKECNDDYEDILPKHKRIDVDNIKNILNCFMAPTPRVSTNTKVSYPSIIEFKDALKRTDNYIFEDDVFELSPPKNPFYDDNLESFDISFS